MNGQPLILVVEKNLHDLELLNSHLAILNFSCICTKQGVRATILAQNYQPNLILLDMMLSDLSANQVINYLKHNPKTASIPIIAVKPLTKVQEYDFKRIAGSDDCITKPYDFNQLEIVVHRNLNQINFSHSTSE
ncbi:response regulator [aff. Roholtiella sp. LEGE 12411]|uniref:response regulator n=1 Tax=aff. Roholtiella sp. LEGE 12411 TaxID=1828822 RepID=UPI001881B452|nr:response regulator [aff. Roholtiella sp. LEGE 12411]MBE9036280.1 response regulator [aff. Roholtiella sp. LEGE 12411]